MKTNIRELLTQLSVSLLLLFVFPNSSESFQELTHARLSEIATLRSSRDDFLKNTFPLTFCYYVTQYTCWGLPNGILEPLDNGKRPLALIQEGAVDEDNPGIRAKHHFHNPRLAWNQAGLSGLCFGCESSIVWSQDQNQIIGGHHSWHDARLSYYQGVTAGTRAERNRLLAETFRSVGHLSHLVQDAANPAHTRDDWHISFGGNGWLGNRDVFHYWATEHDARDMIDGIGTQEGLVLPDFDQSLLDQQSRNDFAPVPIARIIDATDGDRGVLATGTNIGIAEYSNANFFSDDTIFSGDFQFPAASDLEPHEPEIDPLTGETNTYLYFRSGSGGDTDYKVAHASTLRSITNEAVARTDKLLNDDVLSDYGKKLFPRAVSYSKGLIEYFFRPRMFCFGWPPTLGVYVWADGRPNEVASVGELRIITSPDETFDQFNVSAAVQVDLSNQPPDGFDMSEIWNQTTLNQYVPACVFKGKLGDEDEAVAVGPIVLP